MKSCKELMRLSRLISDLGSSREYVRKRLSKSLHIGCIKSTYPLSRVAVQEPTSRSQICRFRRWDHTESLRVVSRSFRRRSHNLHGIRALSHFSVKVRKQVINAASRQHLAIVPDGPQPRSDNRDSMEACMVSKRNKSTGCSFLDRTVACNSTIS